jgi:transcriptional regulator with XRE-family HTH domain
VEEASVTGSASRARPASPVVRKRELARQLKVLRERARLTLEAVAAELEYSAATIHRMETGVRTPRARDVRDLCVLYGASEAMTNRLTGLVEAARQPGWWQAYNEVDDDFAEYIGYEAAAAAIRQYEGTVVPGMLQTSAYTRTYLREAVNPGRLAHWTEYDIDRIVDVRERRQQILYGTPPLEYHAIIDEGTLRRAVGGAEIMREQLRHLMAAPERSPHVTIRVVPLSAGAHPGQQAGFVLMTFASEGLPDVVSLESLAGQIFLESESDLRRHKQVFAVLEQIALPQAESQEALARMVDEL